jgi:hypothetical protein
MRTTQSDATVRLYYLDSEAEGGAATTLFYGSLAEALRIGAEQPEEVQQGLFLATENDVAHFLDIFES